MDRIDIHAVRCQVRLGIGTKERNRKQSVWVHLSLELSLKRAARSDDSKDSVDYHAAALLARQAAQAKPYKLLEAMTEDVAQALLKAHPKIRAVTVRVLKKPSIMTFTQGVSAVLRRSR